MPKLPVALVALALAAPSAAAQCETQLLTPATPATFGQALSRDGERLAVSDGGGRVQVWRLLDGTWEAEAEFESATPGDGFGRAVALADPWLFVGAPDHDGPLLDAIGRVDVWRRDGTTWLAQPSLLPVEPAADEAYGTALATDGERLLVGTPGDDDQADDRGSVALFDRRGQTWVQTNLLTEDGATALSFGSALALDGDRALVGSTDPATSAAWVFEADEEGLWGQTIRVDALDLLDAPPGALFGGAVALAGDVLAVGAPGHVPAGALPGSSGSVYVFRYDVIQDDWFQEQQLIGGATTPVGVHDPGAAAPDAPRAQQAFGSSVQLSAGGRTLVVGAPDGPLGSVHVFKEQDRAWTPGARLLGAPGPGAPLEDGFGSALALDGGSLLVGAPGSGRVHAWEGPWTRPGWQGLGGDSTPDGTRACLTGTGAPTPGSVLELSLQGLQPDAAGWLVFGLERSEQLVAGGLLVPTPQALVPVLADGSGTWRGRLRAPDVPQLLAQAWLAVPGGWQVSNALAAGVDLP